jgi:penicillin-binding protein
MQYGKRGLSMILILLLLALPLAGCGGQTATTTTQAQARPEDTFMAFSAAWADGNYAAMYQLLSSTAKNRVTEIAFIERYDKIMQGIEAKNIVATARPEGAMLAETGTTAVLPFSVQMDTLAGSLDLPGYSMTLIREIGSGDEVTDPFWTVDWTEELIFTDMAPTDRVQARLIQPTRGEIRDRNGWGLAVNGELTVIGLVPEIFKQVREDAIPQMASLLGISEERIAQVLDGASNPDWFYPVVTLPTELSQLSSQLTAIDGVQYQKSSGRIYPAGKAAALLTGYIGAVTAEDIEAQAKAGELYLATDKIGKMGLEQVFEKRLRGRPGGEIVLLPAEGQTIKRQIALQNAMNGETITLALDMTVQNALYEQMGDEAGAAVAQDPTTGEILALVSTPAFDPNLLQTYVPDSVQASWNEAKKPFFRSRFKQVYSPGSVFKLVTAASGLKEGSLEPDVALPITGLQWRPDSSWGQYAITRVSDPGQPVDLGLAFLKSDNIYFAQQALAAGESAMMQGAAGFGIGEVLPVDYPFDDSQLANSDLSNPVLLADTGYGQGEVLLSPIHIAMFYSALATQGDILKPVLEYEESRAPEVWKAQAIVAADVPILREALTAVVSDPAGTAYTADDQGLDLLGKTGTAELKQSLTDEASEENGWFVAMTLDEPRLTVAMVIEDVKNRGGSHFVVPLVKRAIAVTRD